MKIIRRTAWIIAIVLAAVQSSDASTELDWSDLVDQSVQAFEDPYRDLTYEQIDAVRNVLVTRQGLSSASLKDEAREELEDKLADLQSSLSAQGLDADWLISQRWVVAERRERAGTAGNPEVDGQIVTLAGFAIAGPPDADGTSVVYLVPERGMCSHVPPPPPNQMLRVRLSDGWQPQYIHEPVRITGRVSIDPTEQVFHIVDGPVPMRATFSMEAHEVETAKSLLGAVVQNPHLRAQSAGSAAKLKAAGINAGNASAPQE